MALLRRGLDRDLQQCSSTPYLFLLQLGDAPLRLLLKLEERAMGVLLRHILLNDLVDVVDAPRVLHSARRLGAL